MSLSGPQLRPTKSETLKVLKKQKPNQTKTKKPYSSGGLNGSARLLNGCLEWPFPFVLLIRAVQRPRSPFNLPVSPDHYFLPPLNTHHWYFYSLFFATLGLDLRHMEVPRKGGGGGAIKAPAPNPCPSPSNVAPQLHLQPTL